MRMRLNADIFIENLFDTTHLLSCDKWNLTVNLDKTKSMIFNKAGRKLTRESFLYKNNRIDLGMEYKYLGIIFKPSGIFTNAVELLCKKATKSLFCIRQLLMSEKSNISTHLKLFETCVKPILVYCSEIWSLNIVKSNVDIESKYLSMLPVKVQFKFAKALLGVNKQVVNLAVLGELGMYPISIHAFKSAIEFWLHILKSEDTLSV